MPLYISMQTVNKEIIIKMGFAVSQKINDIGKKLRDLVSSMNIDSTTLFGIE